MCSTDSHRPSRNIGDEIKRKTPFLGAAVVTEGVIDLKAKKHNLLLQYCNYWESKNSLKLKEPEQVIVAKPMKGSVKQLGNLILLD